MHSRDDRGNLVKVIPAYHLAGAGKLWCPLPRDIRLLVSSRLQEGGAKEYYLPLLVWMALMLSSMFLWIPSFVRFVSSLSTLSWLVAALQGVLVPVTMTPFLYWSARRMRARVARLIIAEDHCATCGYSLRGVQPEPDGCTVCPECGSAWDRSIAPTLPGAGSAPLAAEFASIFCTDDRGVPISLLRQWRSATLPGISSALPRRFRGIILHQRPGRDTARRAARSMGVLLLGLILWFVFWVEWGAPWLTTLQLPPLQTNILRVLLPAAPLPLFVLLLLAVSRQRTASILAAAGYCGACGENLTSLSLSHDLCTVCPECGCAWRSPAPNNP